MRPSEGTRSLCCHGIQAGKTHVFSAARSRQATQAATGEAACPARPPSAARPAHADNRPVPQPGFRCGPGGGGHRCHRPHRSRQPPERRRRQATDGNTPIDIPDHTAPADGTTLGNADAPVTIYEYSDFQCPFCRVAAAEIVPRLDTEYLATGKAKLIFKNLAFIGQESRWAAEAALCAGDQGKFWEYHNKLYEEQNGENKGAFKVENLKRFAQEIGLNQGEFNTCFDEGTYTGQVADEMDEAERRGVNATPTFFVGQTAGRQHLRRHQHSHRRRARNAGASHRHAGSHSHGRRHAWWLGRPARRERPGPGRRPGNPPRLPLLPTRPPWALAACCVGAHWPSWPWPEWVWPPT